MVRISKHKKILLSIPFFALLLAAFYTLLSSSPEPRHNGRHLTHWLEENYLRRTSSSQEAIRAIGPRAIPTLMQMLFTPDRTFSLSRIAERLNLPIELVQDRSNRGLRLNTALNGFYVLGSNAAPAVPMLIPHLAHRSRSHFAAQALEYIGQPALAPVQQLLISTNFESKRHAVHIILSITKRARPTLEPLLSHPDPVIRAETYLWLRSRQLPKAYILETLLNALGDPDELAASRAAVAIRMLGLDGTNALPRLYELQSTTNALLATEITSSIKTLEKIIRIEQYPRPTPRQD